MKTLYSIPVLVFAAIFQSTIFSRIHLMGGAADIVLLVLIAWALQEEVDDAWQWTLLGGLLVGFISKLPFYFYIPVYLAIIGFARFLRSRFWQAPAIGMFITTVLGTLVMQFAMLVVLQLSGIAVNMSESFGYIIIPSILMNLLLSIPMQAIMSDFAQFVYRSQGKNERI
ncbi:MAG: hypothetical protein ABFD58_07230 [Anaerolineaceae bacterium]